MCCSTDGSDWVVTRRLVVAVYRVGIGRAGVGFWRSVGVVGLGRSTRVVSIPVVHRRLCGRSSLLQEVGVVVAAEEGEVASTALRVPSDRLLRPRRRSRFALRALAGTSTGRNPGRVPIIAHRIGCWHHHPERRHTANRVDPPCRQPAGSVDHLASRTKRHQRQPESDCERSDRGSPGLWPSAGATRKALTSEGWASGRPISPLHKKQSQLRRGAP